MNIFCLDVLTCLCGNHKYTLPEYLFIVYFPILTGTTVITITGTKFGTTDGQVLVEATPATLKSYKDTQIVVTMPPMPDGDYPLIVLVPGVGSADTRYTYVPLLNT